MNWACTTNIQICYMILQLSSIIPQAFAANLTSFADNSTDDNLMTVEKSLIVASVSPNDSSFVVSDVNFLEKSVFQIENERNLNSNQTPLENRENSTTVIPEILDKASQEKNKEPDQGQNKGKVNEGQIKVQTNKTQNYFTASPYLGNIPDDNSDKYRFSHEVFTKSKPNNTGGNKYIINYGGTIITKNNTIVGNNRPFGIGTVSEPIYFNSFSVPGGNISVVNKNKESVNLGSRGYSYSQKNNKLGVNVSYVQNNYPDVKPEESINSFPYHYEGGEPKHGVRSSIEDHGGHYLGAQQSAGGSFNNKGTGGHSWGVPKDVGGNLNNQGSGGPLFGVLQNSGESLDNNFENKGYSRVPVSPPPWMVPPPVEDHQHVRFPQHVSHVNNPAHIEKPVRFEQNIESVVFTTEVPRSGQLEAPSFSSGLYPEVHEQGYDVHSYGSTHKMSTMSQALKFLATIVPLGLFVAALTPSVVNVNATQGMTRSRPVLVAGGGGGREISDRLPSGAVGNSNLEAEQCEMRAVCEAALRADISQSGGTVEERVYTILAQKIPKTPLTTYALDELFSIIRRKSCASFTCNSLKQENFDEWTTTTTMSAIQGTTSAPKKIKRKKKKNPPVT